MSLLNSIGLRLPAFLLCSLISSPAVFAQTNTSHSPYLDANLTSGIVNPSTDDRFELVPKSMSTKSIYLLAPVNKALKSMIAAAEKDNIQLTVLSGFRSYDYQKGIWNRKWEANAGKSDAERVAAIMRYSSLPGISRHHWGTDFDLNSVEPAYWQTKKGLAISEWLRTNAPRFGFCEPYAGKKQGKRRAGYEDEAWHWSYKAIAAPLQKQRTTTIQDVLHKPISGSNVLQQSKARILDFVNQVSPNCL